MRICIFLFRNVMLSFSHANVTIDVKMPKRTGIYAVGAMVSHLRTQRIV